MISSKIFFLRILTIFYFLIISLISSSTFADEKVKEFASIFSPPLTDDKVKMFFYFGVDDLEKVEATYNRMYEANYTDATDINEIVLLNFLFDEAEGKKLGLSAKEHKEKRLNQPKIVTLTWNDGKKWVGGVKDENIRHGKGTMTWPNGNRFEGEYFNDKKTGYGILYLNNNIKYEGEFENDMRNGSGTMTWPSGTIYVGNWKDNEKSGLGTQTEADGSKYVGGWKEGYLHGEGIQTYADGTVKKVYHIDGYSKEFIEARNKKQFKPYAVCIGAHKEQQINTLINLFQSNNDPAAVSYMLDVGCNNSWSTPIRGIDLEEFSRNGRFVGVKTKEIMSGIGWIYAMVWADEWDSN